MRCRECETPNPPERTRCAKCGAKLPLPPGKAEIVEEAPKVKPRRRPAEEAPVEEEEVERRPRRRRKEDYDEEERRPRRRRDEDEDDENDEDYDEEQSTVARVIPYRNAMALVGYYCAIFSLIPAVLYPLIVYRIPIPFIGDVIEAKGDLSFLNIVLPVAGLALGGAALVLGIIGVVQARDNPRARGMGHAGTALFLGTLTFLICAISWLLFLTGVV